MTANYQITLYDPFGVAKTTIKDFISLDYARVVNGIGALSMTISKDYDSLIFSGSDVQVDNQIEVMRSVNGNQYYLDTETRWLVRNAKKTLNAKGERLTTIYARCANDLLNRRIVAYAAGTAQADKTAIVDNSMRAIVRENLGSLATDIARSIATYLSVQADLSLGPSISKAFSRRRVIDVLQELALSAYQAGTYLAFDVVAVSQTQLEFRVYSDQRGIDHRWPSSSSPLLFGPEFGNLTDIVRGYDHENEVTYAYSGGQGIGVSRIIGTASDSVRIGQSPFSRIEKFSDARQTSIQATADDEADYILKSGIPKNTFEATIIDTPQTVYGLHYNFGDYITAVFEGENINARIEKVRVKVKDGSEEITVSIKANY